MSFISDALDSVLGQSKPGNFEQVAPPSAFVIEQLTGRKRKVVLTGRALPYRPFKLSTKQRMELVWLPGYADATVTVLGPAEEPTTVTGYWKDKFVGPNITVAEKSGGLEGLVSDVGSALGFGDPPAAPASQQPASLDGVPINNVQELVSVLDDICREGQLLTVKWGVTTRQGMLEEFEKTWHNAHDVEWSMKFSWSGRGEPQPLPRLTAPTAPKAASLGKVFGDLLKAAQDPKFSLTPELVKDLESDLLKVGALVEGVQGLGGAIADAVMSPLALAQQAAGILSRLVAGADDVASLVESSAVGEMGVGAAVPPGLTDGQSDGFVGGTAAGGGAVDGAGGVSTFSGGVGAGAGGGGAAGAAPPEDAAASAADVASRGFGAPPAPATRGFGELQRARQWTRTVSGHARLLRRLAVQMRSDLLIPIRTEVKALHMTREGEELRAVSRRYYATNDHWQDIMLFNGLRSSMPATGTVLLIPREPSGRGGSGARGV